MSLLQALVLRRATLGVVRLIRRLVILAIVLAVVAALGNVALGSFADRQAGAQIRTAMKLQTSPSVHLPFPILWWVLKGRLPHVTVDAHDVTVQGLTVSRFHLAVDDVRASLSDLTSGRNVFDVGSGTASADVSADAVNAYLATRGVSARVAFAGGTVTVTRSVVYVGTRHSLAATGTLAVRGSNLVFTPSTITFDGARVPGSLASVVRRDVSFTVALPALPGGLRPRSIAVGDGRATLEATLPRGRLDLGRL